MSFDIGKTNLKLLHIDSESEEIINSEVVSNATSYSGFYPHLDTSLIESFIYDGIAKSAKESNEVISSIVVTTHGASGALVKGSELALPILDYEFDGPDTLLDEYNSVRPVFTETLSPALPNGLNLGAQLFWQNHTFKKEFNSATTFLTYPQYWSFKLSGIPSVETTSLGCHTDLWNPLERRFSSLVYSQGWDKLMPRVLNAGDLLGRLKPCLSEYLGMKNKPNIYCGIQDSNASLFPYLNLETDGTLISSGTWAIFFALSDKTKQLDENRDMLANVDALGRPVYSARFMGGREYDKILDGRPTALPSEIDIKNVLSSKSMALPSFAAGTGPFPLLKNGSILNLHDASAGELEVIASVYLALMSQVCLKLLDSSGPIYVIGPFARNDLYCDVLATLTNRTVNKDLGEIATGHGAAQLALPKPNKPTGVVAKGLPESLHQYLHDYAFLWNKKTSKLNSNLIEN